MYLARKQVRGRTHYYIRESYSDHDVLCSRDLLHLGPDPGKYVIYPGGNACYVDETVEDRLRDMGADYEGDELEDIFWPFIRSDIRHALEHFRRRGRSGRSKNKTRPGSGDQFHLFDRRRVHYLRYGQTDQARIGRVSPKLFRVLWDKSRDEIEQYFITAEHILRPHEIKSYAFVIFDLQRHFSESFATAMPQALDQNNVDKFFINEVCWLNEDKRFWTGMDADSQRLHEYLIRYVTLFFDNDYGRSSYLEDLIQNWMNSHRDHRPPRTRQTVSVKEASTIFGVPEDELKKMSKKELSRLFRRKAQEFHPDKGGDHDTFIRLTEAYQDLKARKK